MIVVHGKREGTLYMTSGSTASISIASLELDARLRHQRLEHMSVKGIKAMLSKNKLSGVEIYILRFM